MQCRLVNNYEYNLNHVLRLQNSCESKNILLIAFFQNAICSYWLSYSITKNP